MRTEGIHHHLTDARDGLVPGDLRHGEILVAGTGIRLKIGCADHGTFLRLVNRLGVVEGGRGEAREGTSSAVCLLTSVPYHTHSLARLYMSTSAAAACLLPRVQTSCKNMSTRTLVFMPRISSAAQRVSGRAARMRKHILIHVKKRHLCCAAAAFSCVRRVDMIVL